MLIWSGFTLLVVYTEAISLVMIIIELSSVEFEIFGKLVGSYTVVELPVGLKR